MDKLTHKNITIILDWKSTKEGFKHIAKLYNNYFLEEQTKILYYNRTWERFDYESIINKIINMYMETIEQQALFSYKQNHNIKRITKEQLKDFKKELKNYDTYHNLQVLKNRVNRAYSLGQLEKMND